MGTEKITREQCEKVSAAIGPTLGYLTRLCRRLEAIGTSGDDPLYLSAMKAQAAMQGLFIDLHYRSYKGGVGMALAAADDPADCRG